MVQKYILHKPAEASPIMPADVALVSQDGGYALGRLSKLSEGRKATVADLTKAYNALLDRLGAACLCELEEPEGGEE